GSWKRMAGAGSLAGLAAPEAAEALNLPRFQISGGPLPVQGHAGGCPDKSADHDLGAGSIFTDGHIRVAARIVVAAVVTPIVVAILRGTVLIPRLCAVVNERHHRSGKTVTGK